MPKFGILALMIITGFVASILACLLLTAQGHGLAAYVPLAIVAGLCIYWQTFHGTR